MNKFEEQALNDELRRCGDHRVNAASLSCSVEHYRVAARRVGRKHGWRNRTIVNDGAGIVVAGFDRGQTGPETSGHGQDQSRAPLRQRPGGAPPTEPPTRRRRVSPRVEHAHRGEAALDNSRRSSQIRGTNRAQTPVDRRFRPPTAGQRRRGSAQRFRWSKPLLSVVPPTGFEPALPP